MPTLGAYVDNEIYNKYSKVAKENNMSMSKMVKQALITSQIIDNSPKIDLLRELNRIGQNINQISKHANTKKVVDRMTLEKLIEIEGELRKLYDCQDV